MSLDRSLKSANALIRHRNVLTRAERLVKLQDEEKWAEGKNSVFGLPKVGHRKLEQAKGVKEEAAADGAAATTTAGAAPAAAGKAAAGGKAAPAAAAGAKGAAAPSAGGKSTAPAAGKGAPAAKKK